MTDAGVAGVFTRLGENVKDLAEADEVAEHYLEASVASRALGLDVRALGQAHAARPRHRSRARCAQHVRLARGRARRPAATSVDRHGAVLLRRRHARPVRAVSREELPAVGVCLQAYLFRTAKDLEAIIAAGGIGVRLVKGAYKEPATVAYPKKADVDANYLALAQTMLGTGGARERVRAPCSARTTSRSSTRIQQHATGHERGQRRLRVPPALRHPARRAACASRATARRVRVLISYGDVLVPLVHAPPRRTAGQRLVRGEEPVRLAPQFTRAECPSARTFVNRAGSERIGELSG